MNIAIRDLSFFRGERAILQNINADFADRSITALTGGNGCGKSTLLKLIAGLLKYQQGTQTGNFTAESLCPAGNESKRIAPVIPLRLRE